MAVSAVKVTEGLRCVLLGRASNEFCEIHSSCYADPQHLHLMATFVIVLLSSDQTPVLLTPR